MRNDNQGFEQRTHKSAGRAIPDERTLPWAGTLAVVTMKTLFVFTKKHQGAPRRASNGLPFLRLAGLTVAFILLGCRVDSTQSAPPITPREVVTAYFTFIDNGHTAAALELRSTDRRQTNRLAVERLARTFESHGGVEHSTIAEMRGYHPFEMGVSARLHMSNGSVLNRELGLVQEQGAWKVVVDSSGPLIVIDIGNLGRQTLAYHAQLEEIQDLQKEAKGDAPSKKGQQ